MLTGVGLLGLPSEPPWFANSARGAAPALSPTDPVGSAARQKLRELFRAKLAPSRPELVDSAVDKFLTQLRETAPISAENLAAGRVDTEEMDSRVGLYLAAHPELTGQAMSNSAKNPGIRLSELIRLAAKSAETDETRRALAERFLRQLAERSRNARDAFLAGAMPDDELQSRVTVFLAEVEAEKNAPAPDLDATRVTALIDSFVAANYGPVGQRPLSICYRGTIEENGVKRDFVIFKKYPAKLRIHIVENGQVVGILATDGVTAWRQSVGEPVARPATGKEATGLANLARFDDPLVEPRERGARVELAKDSEASKIRLRILEADGTETESSIDPATLTEWSRREHHPGEAWQETRFKNYRKVGAANIAFVQEKWTGNRLRSTTRIAELKADPGLLDQFFSPPPESPLDFMDCSAALATLQRGRKLQPSDAVDELRP